MRLISWNVNGIRAVHKKEQLLPLVKEYEPDFLFIQEIKGQVDQFTKEIREPENYSAHYNSAEKKGYSGTGVWVKNGIPEGTVFTDFDQNPNSNEGRMVDYRFSANGQNYAVIGVYFPNGGKSEQAWQEKLVFYDRFLDHVNRLRSAGYVCIWCGDVNCAHNEIDLARPKENDGVIGFHPLERRWIDKLIQNDWCDIFRTRHPEATDVYSWWHLVTRARARNIGWRIDYFFIDAALSRLVKNIDYLMDYQGSDHCPVLLDIDL